MLLAQDRVRAFVPYPPVPVAGRADGALAGLSFGVKDLFDVAGYRTGCGNPVKLAESQVAAAHAPVVAQLLEAGAIFVGKTHTEELAWSLYGMNCHFGTPLNPAAPDRVPGGSSSGSASAVAARLCDFALGSDTGGSVRAPASFCGIYGLRPTHGRISLDGAMPLAPSFDTCGFFARDLATMSAVARVLLGAGERTGTTPRLAIAQDMFARLPSVTAEALKPVVAQFGDKVASMSIYGPSPEELAAAFRVLQAREAWTLHGPWFEKHRPPLLPSITERFVYARGVTDAEVAAARDLRSAFAAQIAAALGADTILVAPAVQGPAPRLDADVAALDAYRQEAMAFLSVAGLAGLPQLVVPAGKIDGAPIGLSLIGPAGSDDLLIDAAKRFA